MLIDGKKMAAEDRLKLGPDWAVLDGEWIAIDSRMKLGTDWKPLIHLEPGESMSASVEFGLDEFGVKLLQSGMSAALCLHFYDFDPSYITGDLRLPLSRP